MFNNLFYLVKNVFVEICIDFCLYMLSIIVLRKKIRIGKNTYRPKNHKSAKKISIKYAIYSLLYRCTNEHYRLGVDRYVFFRADTDTDYYRSSRPITDILNRYTCLV